VASTLVFPDGVRLAAREEIPGSREDRDALWTRVEAASIQSGFVIFRSGDARFSHYAEVNIDAPQVWSLFRDLCGALLGQFVNLIGAPQDSEPFFLGAANLADILSLLEPHQYQLCHDGDVQFGIVYDDDIQIREVLVSPTKHFQVWLGDETAFRSVMKEHGLKEHERLEFLDEYPRTFRPLHRDRVAFASSSDLFHHLTTQLRA
jgi:hypothetical protein